MSEWQPIGTAPEPDGNRFCSEPMLLTNGKDVWSAVRRSLGGTVYFQCHGATGYEWEDNFDNPTHWMPLPKPPEEKP